MNETVCCNSYKANFKFQVVYDINKKVTPVMTKKRRKSKRTYSPTQYIRMPTIIPDGKLGLVKK